jgi:hypothetical protein
MRYVTCSAAAAAAIATFLAFSTVATAQGPNKCLAAKNKCASRKMQALLKCHSRAEKTGVAVDPACTQRAMSKFDGGTAPAKGCFAKLEAANDGPCLTTDDTSAIETKIDAFVLDVVSELDPAYPAPVQNDCSAGKKRCVLKKSAALMKCNEHNVKFGVPIDPACGQKAKDKFDGGIDPTAGCFERLEARFSCPTNDDTAALEGKVDNFVTDVLCELGYNPIALAGHSVFCNPTPTPTPTLTSTAATPTTTRTPRPCNNSLFPQCAAGDCGPFSQCFNFGSFCGCEPPTPTPPNPTPTPNAQLCGGSAPACNGACPTDAGDCRNVGGTCMCVGGRPTETPTPMPTP